MDNTDSIKMVDGSLFEPEDTKVDWQIRKPCYNSYCFSDIPDTVLSLLGAKPRGSGTLAEGCIPSIQDIRHIALLFIDSFGWDALERFSQGDKRIRSLEQLRDRAICSKITTQFPSTTAAHVSCIHSGLPVYQSGVYEWFHYNRKADQIISPLIFSGLSPYGVNTLLRQDLSPEAIFPAPDFYPRFKEANIIPRVFQARPFIESPYNKFILKGALTHPFTNYQQGLKEMGETILKDSNPGYSFFYHDAFDHVCHNYGPVSPAGDRIAEEIFNNINRLFLEPLKGQSDVLVLITADHGQTNIDPSTTLFLDKLSPELTTMIVQNNQDIPLVPAGSPRDLFLHIKPEYISEAKQIISELCENRAVVMTTEELIAQGFFGPVATIGQELRDNLASLAVLPGPGESVYWWGGGEFESAFLGHHGGVTTSEMDSILLALTP